jgi:hypothetical protein
MSKVGGEGSDRFRKAGPLEQTWIERHRKRADCKCEVIVKKGFATYVCEKCGKEI